MYELTVEAAFRADHAISIGGDREERHGHDWRVRVVVGGEDLDADGLLCDFHELEGQLENAVANLRGADLNAVSPFDAVNPTAEHVARHLAESLAPDLPERVTLRSVHVTEAPGCTATYIPSQADRLH